MECIINAHNQHVLWYRNQYVHDDHAPPPDFFKRIFINDGAVTWPGEIDLAPDAMHDEIKNHGEWVLA